MDPKNLSDEDLAVLVRTKDPELYRELVERYQNKMGTRQLSFYDS